MSLATVQVCLNKIPEKFGGILRVLTKTKDGHVVHKRKYEQVMEDRKHLLHTIMVLVRSLGDTCFDRINLRMKEVGLLGGLIVLVSNIWPVLPP